MDISSASTIAWRSISSSGIPVVGIFTTERRRRTPMSLLTRVRRAAIVRLPRLVVETEEAMNPVSLGLVLWILFPVFGQSSSELVTINSPRITTINGRPAIEVTLTNRAAVAMTAWKIDFTFQYSDGRQGAQALARDAYPAAAGIDPRGTLAPPNGDVIEVLTLAPRTGSIEAPRATVTWVIFADGTWIGDPAGVTETFLQRQRDEQAWRFVADAMQVGRKVGGREGLARALAYLDRIDQDDAQNRAKVGLRRRLQAALEVADPGDLTTQRFFEEWFQTATARVATTAQHARQQGRRVQR